MSLSNLKKPQLFVLPNWVTIKAFPWKSMGAGLSVYVALLLISVIMMWGSDWLSPQSSKLTRFMAKNQAPLIGNFYPSTVLNDITVLMYDQEYLENTNSAWPIKYSDHADWLIRIAEQKPKAIFVDITFDQKRDDSSISNLKDALCSINKKYGIPVYLAGLSKAGEGESAELRIRDELMPANGDSSRDCLKLVSVNYETDKVDHISWSYPLYSYRDSNGWHQAHAEVNNGNLMRSPALAMANDVGQIDFGTNTAPLALVWGLKGSAAELLPSNLANCEMGKFTPRLVLPSFLTYFIYDEEKTVCPYNRSFSMSKIGEMDDQEYSEFITGKYVLVGASIPGTNDFVESPIHGLIPGVFLHAMALDNLLTYGTSYKRDVEWAHLNIQLIESALVATFVIFIIKWLRRILTRGERKETPSSQHRTEDSSMLCRLKELVYKFVWWSVLLVANTIIAMGVIALMQSFFDIGMLPVADLVSVVIFAEAIEWLKYLQYVINGKSEEEATA